MSTANLQQPIRVGIIGLSAGGGWASMAHLPYLRQTTKYKVTAVSNSSVQSSEKAIKKYELEHAHPFDSVQSMCRDGQVDLVVCAVAVFSHYELIKPAIEMGKDVYVEWPLAGSTEQALELAELAEAKGVRTVVGMQGTVSHITRAMESVVESGKIGRVLSTQLFGSACTGEIGKDIIQRYEYFKDRKSEGFEGQVMLTIYVGHTFAPVTKVLGAVKHVASQICTTWPKVNIVDENRKVVSSNVDKTADDYASLQGETTSGVKFTYCLRGGDSFSSDDHGLVWDIIGDKGEMRLTGSTIMMNMGAEDYKLRVKDYSTGTIETVELSGQLDVALPAQNIGRLYENFATGEFYPTFRDALNSHRFMDSVFKSAEEGGNPCTVGADTLS